MDTPESIAKFIAFLPEQVPYNPERQHIADAAAKLSKTAFQSLLGCFTGLALTAAGGRILFHIRRRGKLFADDVLIIFASCCLAVATGFLYYVAPKLYMMEALNEDPKNAVLFSRSEVLSLFGLLKWLNLYLAFSWTANYAKVISAVVVYSGFYALSWLLNILQNPVNCGGNTEVKCYPYPSHVSELGWVCCLGDIAADLMIVLIPILLLRKSLLRLSQKLRILSFLCLNVFCIAIALGRTIGGAFHERGGHPVFRIVYIYTMIQLESCISVIMGGITAFRTVFAAHIRDRERRDTVRRSFTFYHRIISWFKRSGSKSGLDHDQLENEERKRVLEGPATGATMRGLRTFIRRHKRDPGHTTYETTMDGSQYDPLKSYHEYIRRGKSHSASATLNDQNMRRESESRENNDAPERPLPVLQMHNLV